MNMKILISNEQGSIIVLTMVVLMMMTLIGIWATNDSTVEREIAANDILYKRAFYEADSGTEFISELLEQNISCPGGFLSDTDEYGESSNQATVEGIKVTNLKFWLNTEATPASDTNRDAYYPADYTDYTDGIPNTPNAPHTNFTIGGGSGKAKGSSLQMAAGYEGKGKGSAGGGTFLVYDIYSNRIERNNTEATIMVRWRHVIGNEGDCYY